MNRVGIENIAQYEHDLLVYGMQQLGAIPGVRLVGTAAHKASVMSFVLAGYTTDEVGRRSTRRALRCAPATTAPSPSCAALAWETTVRPSLAFYNTFDEIDCLTTVVRRLAAQRRWRTPAAW